MSCKLDILECRGFCLEIISVGLIFIYLTEKICFNRVFKLFRSRNVLDKITTHDQEVWDD